MPIDVLPIISHWLDQASHRHRLRCKYIRRKYLTEWVRSQAVVIGISKPSSEQVQLIVDCMIAAGIGQKTEQYATVYGGYTYPE